MCWLPLKFKMAAIIMAENNYIKQKYKYTYIYWPNYKSHPYVILYM